MRGISFLILIIMIHSSYQLLAVSAEDLTKEIEMVSRDQYKEHLITLNQTKMTEAAVNFENKYRDPAPSKALTFFPLKLKPKPSTKPKTKVATIQEPVPPKIDLNTLYREQTL